jgi:hypothetical protein
LVVTYLSDDEYRALQEELARNPDASPVVPGSGGVREIRWAAHVLRQIREEIDDD